MPDSMEELHKAEFKMSRAQCWDCRRKRCHNCGERVKAGGIYCAECYQGLFLHVTDPEIADG